MQAEIRVHEQMQRELALARAERDWCQALLAQDADTGAQVQERALAQLQRIMAQLEVNARSPAAFKALLSGLTDGTIELARIVGKLYTPMPHFPLDNLLNRMRRLQAKSDANGDDLMPIISMLDIITVCLRNSDRTLRHN